MRKESKFYTIIKNACNGKMAFYHKIADSFPSPNKRFVPKKPFDLFFVWDGISCFIEVKYMPEIKAFSVQKQLSEHQNDSLIQISLNSGLNNKRIRSLVLLGIYKPREIKRIYVFDYDWLQMNPLKKKDLLKINKYLDIKKNTFELEDFFKNIIGGSNGIE